MCSEQKKASLLAHVHWVKTGQPQACSWSAKSVHEGREDPWATSWRRVRKLPQWSCWWTKAVHGVFLQSKAQSPRLMKCPLDFLPEKEMGFWDAVQSERRQRGRTKTQTLVNLVGIYPVRQRVLENQTLHKPSRCAMPNATLFILYFCWCHARGNCIMDVASLC